MTSIAEAVQALEGTRLIEIRRVANIVPESSGPKVESWRLFDVGTTDQHHVSRKPQVATDGAYRVGAGSPGRLWRPAGAVWHHVQQHARRHLLARRAPAPRHRSR